MSWLLAKDRPWILGGSLVGIVGLAAALLEYSGETLFVIGAGHPEAAFHVAWIAGVVLGAVAGCFDEVLGTREFLAQRPIARSAVVAARLRGVVTVLGAWFVLAPLAAWLVFAIFDGEAGLTRMVVLPPMLAVITPAVSGAGIGLAAASLPLVWWQRLLVAGAFFGSLFPLAYEWTHGPGYYTQAGTFALVHLAIGVVLFALAAIAVQNDADSDRPLPQSLLWFAGVPVAAALATLWAAFLGEAQTVAVQGLERAYPEAMRRDGSFVLTRAIREKSMERHVVDVEHRATGETIDPRVHGSETFGRRWPWFGGSFRLDAPRWHGGSESASVVGASVRLSADGQAWTSGPRGRLQPTGRGPEQQPFAADSTLAEVGEGIVIVDKVSHEVWRYDAGLQHFVPLQLPSGERCRGVERLRLADDDEEARWKAQLVPSGQSWRDAWFLRGERDAFLVRDGVVVAVPGLLERVDREPRERRGSPRVTREEDPLVYTLQLPDDGSPVTFTHEFRPRTAHEWLHAGTAMLWSLQRPPFLQVPGHVGSPPSTAAWAFDRLTIDGRRPWLVGAGILFAAILAFGFARRLRRLGVNGAVVAWWSGAILLFGVPAVVLGFALERPRRYAQRAVATPPPAPRIHTPYAPEVA